MIEDKIIHKLSELLADFKALEKQYRDEYHSAVDIEDLDAAKQVHSVAFEKIRSVKNWKVELEKLSSSINQKIVNEKNQESLPRETQLYIKEATTNEDVSMDAENVCEDNKIGIYVREKMYSLCHYEFSDEEIKSITSKEWSKDVLELSYSFAKIYIESIELCDQIKDQKKRNCYWSEVFSFGSRRMLITNNWYEKNREKFDDWYNSIDASSNKIDKQEIDNEISEEDQNRAEQSIKIALFGKTYSAKPWNEVIAIVCEAMLLKKPYIVAKLDRAEELNNIQGIGFSYIGNNTKSKKRLSNGLFVEVDSSFDNVELVCKKILQLCGYKESELIIDYE